jgi:hypothetical protein
MKMNLWAKWFGRAEPPDYTTFLFVNSLSDVPQHTGKTIYVVGNRKKNKWVVFECPNHCGKRIEVNLMSSKYPYWTLTIKKKKISLWPSVVVKDCGAHFYLTRNKVIGATF